MYVSVFNETKNWWRYGLILISILRRNRHFIGFVGNRNVQTLLSCYLTSICRLRMLIGLLLVEIRQVGEFYQIFELTTSTTIVDTIPELSHIVASRYFPYSSTNHYRCHHNFPHCPLNCSHSSSSTSRPSNRFGVGHQHRHSAYCQSHHSSFDGFGD